MAAAQGLELDEGTGTVSISFRLPRDLADRLARLAAQNDRSVSAELRRAVVVHIFEREGT